MSTTTNKKQEENTPLEIDVSAPGEAVPPSPLSSPDLHKNLSISSLEGPQPPTPESDRVSDGPDICEVLMHPKDRVQRIAPCGSYEIYVKEGGDVQQQEKAKEIAQKCVCLTITRENSELGHEAEPESANGFGHAGLVFDHEGVARFVTTKHCLKTKESQNGDKIPIIRILALSVAIWKKPSIIVFPDMNYDQKVPVPKPHILRNNESWKAGIDTAWSNIMSPEGLKGASGFQLVRNEFRLEAGQKIGIVIYNRYGVKPSDGAVKSSDYDAKRDNLAEEQLNDIFGPAESIVIFQSKINYVDDEQTYIEYNMNTFRSCSGAVIFLLDADQPLSVQDVDKGKAIAVHAGFKKELGTNIGFRLKPPGGGDELTGGGDELDNENSLGEWTEKQVAEFLVSIGVAESHADPAATKLLSMSFSHTKKS